MAVRLIGREKESPRIRTVQMDNLIGLFGIRGTDRVFSDSLAILKECGMIGLVKVYIWGSV